MYVFANSPPNNSVVFVSLLNSFTDFHCYRTRRASVALMIVPIYID